MSGILSGLLNSLGETHTQDGAGPASGTLGGPLAGVETSAVAGFIGHAIQQAGGIQGIAAAFQQAGLGDKVQSWLGNGPNAPVSAAEVQQVFSPEQIDSWAQAHGLPAGLATQVLAHLLPTAVDHATPGGVDATGQPMAAAGDDWHGLVSRLLAR